MTPPTNKAAKAGYYYEIHDGDEWVSGDGRIYDKAEDAKRAGIEAGFDYVRVKCADHVSRPTQSPKEK